MLNAIRAVANFTNYTACSALIVTNFRVCNNDIFEVACALSVTNYDTHINTFHNDFGTAYYKVLDCCVFNCTEQACACSRICVILACCIFKIPTLFIKVVNCVSLTVECTHKCCVAIFVYSVAIADGVKVDLCKVDISTKLYCLTCERILNFYIIDNCCTVNDISKACELFSSCKSKFGICCIVPRIIGCTIPNVSSCLSSCEN